MAIKFTSDLDKFTLVKYIYLFQILLFGIATVSYGAMHHHKKSVYANPVPCTCVSFGDATRFV